MSTEHIGTGPEGVAGGSLSDSDGEQQWRTDAPTADRDATADEAASEDDDAVYYEEQVEPEYGILGFTLRELIIVGAWVVVFVVSFFPVFGGGGSVWTRGIDWILTIGLPTVAVFLIALRRFSPEGIRRVGSLGIDQFASVASSVAAVAWAQLLWLQSAASVDSGAFLVGWVPIVAQLATLALVAATVAAPLIPRLRDDFEGRMETLAHRNANPVRPVITRPRPAAVVASGTDAAEPAEPIIETDLVIEDDADATRVIEVLPPAAPSVTAEPAVVHEDSDEVFPPAAAGAEPAPVAYAEPAPVPPVDPEAREHDTAYTDPIGALHEIFAANEPAEDTTADDAADDRSAAGDLAENTTAVLPVAGAFADEPVAETEAPLRRTRNEQAKAADHETQPFWILAQSERDVLDEHGHPLFRIGPAAWTLVIEDRGGAYVVRHDDGRIGYLHDLADITKG
ncbi:hypothetical protein [Microbacterium arabinogalactanolyticum]|uniref:Uncharacterized protein n=1 Tax=Microbacterium arabinogalactanolyticum TaxID=69365 RepID=A0ABQ5ND83_9MICO|nr:hypothetical protein [Microbacterium arabinogalactanolyticum]GLC83636.1 hypothetical protein MIAR_02240 [Microbacterium arabinogalactanolyticum]